MVGHSQVGGLALDEVLEGFVTHRLFLKRDTNHALILIVGVDLPKATCRHLQRVLSIITCSDLAWYAVDSIPRAHNTAPLRMRDAVNGIEHHCIERNNAGPLSMRVFDKDSRQSCSHPAGRKTAAGNEGEVYTSGMDLPEQESKMLTMWCFLVEKTPHCEMPMD